MEWIICLAIAVYIFYRIFSGGNIGKKESSARTIDPKDKDVFAGNSVTSYFFLEEFIDQNGKKRNLSNTNTVEPEFIEEELSEDELFDDCFFEDEFWE